MHGVWIIKEEFMKSGPTGSALCIQANRKRLNLSHCRTSSSTCKVGCERISNGGTYNQSIQDSID